MLCYVSQKQLQSYRIPTQLRDTKKIQDWPEIILGEEFGEANFDANGTRVPATHREEWWSGKKVGNKLLLTRGWMRVSARGDLKLHGWFSIACTSVNINGHFNNSKSSFNGLCQEKILRSMQLLILCLNVLRDFSSNFSDMHFHKLEDDVWC